MERRGITTETSAKNGALFELNLNQMERTVLPLKHIQNPMSHMEKKQSLPQKRPKQFESARKITVLLQKIPIPSN